MTITISRRALVQGASLIAAAAPAAAQTSVTPVIRLHLNENPYGPSDRAKAAMQAALDDGWMYDNEDVGATDVFFDLDANLAVTE